MAEIDILRRRLARGEQARLAAEQIIEAKSLELYEKNQQLAAIARQLAKYLPSQVCESIITGRITEVSAARKFITVMFSDLHGFSHATEVLEPEEMALLLNEYLSAMAQLTAAFGGTFDKSMGDGLMILFGAPQSQGRHQDAEACVRLGLAMQQRIVELNEQWSRRGITQELKPRIGIHSGFCTVGNFGSESRLEFTAIGGPVNLTARIEKATVPGQVVISGATHALVPSLFCCHELGAINVKGISAPVQMFRVLDEPVTAVEENLPETAKALLAALEKETLPTDVKARLREQVIAAATLSHAKHA